MPPPIKVELVAHDPNWATLAADEAVMLRRLVGPNLMDVHHIGSTAIPGIAAKPIVDLIPVVRSLVAFDDSRGCFETAGYEWWGEFGLPGRRYCTRDDPGTGRRSIQLHVFPLGSSEIDRHLAFRDYLRADRVAADSYEREKRRCLALHAGDSHAYSHCKGDWIKRTEVEAMRCR